MINSSLPLVLVTHTLPEGWLDKLKDRCQIVIGPEDANSISPNLESSLHKADGLFTLLTINVDEELLSRAPKLKVISNMAVGVDNIDLAACTSRRIPVGNTPGVLTDGTADLTMAIMLAAARRLFEANLDARQGRWKTWSPTGWLGKDLRDATLGIIGMGKIGSAVAERAKGFGMKLIYSDPNPRREIALQLGANRVSFEEVLQQSDFISLHVPLTENTRSLIDETALRSMKPSAILINTARGQIIDPNALLQALTNGWIAGAALDVTVPEPLPPDHPFYELPNCLIVPHIGSATWNTRRKMAERACENLLAGINGRKLPYCVNPEVYEQQ
jgi:lactate dehydrogenase-like 2-hydroxyacid dehydrogenase